MNYHQSDEFSFFSQSILFLLPNPSKQALRLNQYIILINLTQRHEPPSLHSLLPLNPLISTHLLILHLFHLNILPTPNTLLGLKLSPLLLPSIHLHLNPHIHLSIHLINRQIHYQPGFLDQQRNFVDAFADIDQGLVDLVDGEGEVGGLLVDHFGICVDEGVGELEIFPAVLEDVFEGDS